MKKDRMKNQMIKKQPELYEGIGGITRESTELQGKWRKAVLKIYRHLVYQF
jgi:hypothetical protein